MKAAARKPMRRTPFRRKVEGPSFTLEAKPRAEARAARIAAQRPPVTHCSATMTGSASGAPVVKAQMLQHAGYMAAVRDLGYCMRCRCACRPQFCHKDAGKGTGIKTDCREGWPGCAECHRLVGSTGFYTKDERRALELDLGRRTRFAVLAAGTWPARLPLWGEA